MLNRSQTPSGLVYTDGRSHWLSGSLDLLVMVPKALKSGLCGPKSLRTNLQRLAVLATSGLLESHHFYIPGMAV